MNRRSFLNEPELGGVSVAAASLSTNIERRSDETRGTSGAEGVLRAPCLGSGAYCFRMRDESDVDIERGRLERWRRGVTAMKLHNVQTVSALADGDGIERTERGCFLSLRLRPHRLLLQSSRKTTTRSWPKAVRRASSRSWNPLEAAWSAGTKD